MKILPTGLSLIELVDCIELFRSKGNLLLVFRGEKSVILFQVPLGPHQSNFYFNGPD